jgi:hypothetical protein
MENKYYVPELSEFHIGFECEFKNKMQSNKWEKQVCDYDLLAIVLDTYEHDNENFAGQFRVQNLDEEAILNLGFKKMTKEEIKYFGGIYGDCYLTKIREAPSGKYTALIVKLSKLSYINSNNIDIYIKREHALRGYGKAFLIFTGLIRNKNELKKIFKILNVL